ncbi:MAG: sigma 54-interacting transcriptional regulator [Sandaracinus sp.]
MSTVPHVSVSRLPVRTLAAEVVDGPDRGLRAEGEAVSIGTAEGNALRVGDPTVSRFHAEITAAGTVLRVRDLGSTNGTRVGAVRLERGDVAPGAVLELGGTKVRVSAAGGASVELLGAPRLGPFVGRSPVLQTLMARLSRVAATDAAVLLVGESGTGKEVAAEALHRSSPRASEPFLVVDCGAIAPTLVGSELFGHERGAFTGADRTSHGAFERAGRGTVFLDEIGELPLALQTTLLGVLERRRFRRLGSEKELPLEARVVAATHRDLREEVNAGRFRLDLYYRLAVVTLAVPPLREHLDDLVPLIDHFLAERGSDQTAEMLFGPDALVALEQHAFPGNVRELRNLVEATLALGEMPALARPASSPAIPDAAIDALLELPFREAKQALVDRFERRYVMRWLERTAGNAARAARETGLDRSYLTDLIRKHRLREG